VTRANYKIWFRKPSWTGLNHIAPNALDSVSVNKIRKFARRSYRYMSAYRLGLPCKAAIYLSLVEIFSFDNVLPMINLVKHRDKLVFLANI
jgi:hypothetical protein